MEIKLAGRVMPRGPSGDVKFKHLSSAQYEIIRHGEVTHQDDPPGILDVFTTDEVTELVNRAIYQLEYQAASHRKRGQAERARMKLLKEQLGKAGAKDASVKEQLKGDKL